MEIIGVGITEFAGCIIAGRGIARLHELGILQVGPDSAEANPGPACYMRGGTRPTVTDALVTAGYFPDTGLLGGRMKAGGCCKKLNLSCILLIRYNRFHENFHVPPHALPGTA